MDDITRRGGAPRAEFQRAICPELAARSSGCGTHSAELQPREPPTTDHEPHRQPAIISWAFYPPFRSRMSGMLAVFGPQIKEGL
jgi:hypothetical protein